MRTNIRVPAGTVTICFCAQLGLPNSAMAQISKPPTLWQLLRVKVDRIYFVSPDSNDWPVTAASLAD
jgi:hypothetical protein